MTLIADNLILFTATMAMACGVYQDIKDRRFPNTMIYSLLFLGLFYSFYKHQIPEAVLGFILINAFGVLCHKYHLIAPGDMKYLATIFLFISILDWFDCIVFIIAATIFALLQSSIFYHKKYAGDKKQIKDQIKTEAKSLSYLIKFRINTFTEVSRKKYANTEEMRKNSMPYTIPFFLAFVVSFVIPQIMQLFV